MRKFVQRSAAKKAAYTRDSGIIVNLLLALPLRQLLGSHVLLRMLVSIRDHGSEFEDIDRLAALTDSLLAKKRLAGRVNLYGDACSYDGDSQYHTDASREHDVKGSLEGKVAWPTFLGSNSIGIGSGCLIASCRYETLRRSRVLDGRRKFRRHRSMRAILPINDLTDH